MTVSNVVELDDYRLPAELKDEATGLTDNMESLIVVAFESGKRAARSETSALCAELRDELEATYAALTPALIEEVERPFRGVRPSPILAARFDGARDVLSLVQAAILSDAQKG